MLAEVLGDQEWLFDVAVAILLCFIYVTISRLFFPNEKERAYVVSVRATIVSICRAVASLKTISTGNFFIDMHLDRTLHLSLRNELGHIPLLLEAAFVYC